MKNSLGENNNNNNNNNPVPADHRVKLRENEKRDKYLDLARKLNKTMEHENNSDANCNWCARYSCSVNFIYIYKYRTHIFKPINKH